MNPGAPPGLDMDTLAGWLGPRLEVDDATALEAELIAGGRSNLTYLVHADDRRWVLRRPPLGRRLATAHSMAREERVLGGLAQTDIPAPTVVASCEDETVIGVPFYVMDYIEGRVIRSPADDDLDPGQHNGCATSLVRTLARLHGLDYAAIGLDGLGRPDGYLERQMQRWGQQLEASRVRDLPALDGLAERLAAALPRSGGAAILHGDYRIDNVLLDLTNPTRIVAVLDWEMATLGDPLCDLGMLLMYWGQPGERHATPVHAITAADGFPSRHEVIAAYAEATGADLSELPFYVAFSYFKLAVIVEGIHARHLEGATVGEGYDEMAAIPPVLAEQGLEVLG
jgi:aminoglycoside phosphotransferase (APT) family kinase protein